MVWCGVVYVEFMWSLCGVYDIESISSQQPDLCEWCMKCLRACVCAQMAQASTVALKEVCIWRSMHQPAPQPQPAAPCSWNTLFKCCFKFEPVHDAETSHITEDNDHGHYGPDGLAPTANHSTHHQQPQHRTSATTHSTTAHSTERQLRPPNSPPPPPPPPTLNAVMSVTVAPTSNT